MRIRIKKTDMKRNALLDVCKRLRIRRYSHLNKEKLTIVINQYYASMHISRTWLLYKNTNKVFINTHDPITQEVIEKPYFCINVGEDKYARYNMCTFYEYMIRTGHFKDPFTEYQFNDNDLKEMDKQMRSNQVYKQSLYAIKNNPHCIQHYEDKQQEQNYLLGLDRQIGELIIETVHIINNDNESIPYFIITHIFLPNFFLLLHQMQRINPEYTKSALHDYKCVLKNYHIREDVYIFLLNVFHFEAEQITF